MSDFAAKGPTLFVLRKCPHQVNSCSLMPCQGSHKLDMGQGSDQTFSDAGSEGENPRTFAWQQSEIRVNVRTSDPTTHAELILGWS